MRPRCGPFQLNHFALLKTVLFANGDRRFGWPMCSPRLDLRLSARGGLVLLLFGRHFEAVLASQQEIRLPALSTVVNVIAHEYESGGLRLACDGEGELSGKSGGNSALNFSRKANLGVGAADYDTVRHIALGYRRGKP